MFKLDLEEAESQRLSCQHLLGHQKARQFQKTSIWIIEKAREFQKNIYFCFIDYAKAFDCVYHQTTWPASWEVCMQVKKQQLNLDMEKQTHSK